MTAQRFKQEWRRENISNAGGLRRRNIAFDTRGVQRRARGAGGAGGRR